MNRLRFALFQLVFYGGSVIYVLLAPIVAVFGRGPLRFWVRGWARWHQLCTRALLGIRSRVVGTLPDRPVLVASKHEAMFETVELVLLLNTPVVVMKAELGRIPFWGWTAKRYGMIAIEREGSAAALRAMTREAKAAIADGRPIVLFPEGTRVPHGETAPLRPGFAGLYRALGVETVPLAVDSGNVWPRHGTPRPGIITFAFGDPIPPGMKRQEAEARTVVAINALNPPSVVGAPEIVV